MEAFAWGVRPSKYFYLLLASGPEHFMSTSRVNTESAPFEADGLNDHWLQDYRLQTTDYLTS